MKKYRYSVTIFWLIYRYSAKTDRCYSRWNSMEKVYFSNKKEALQYASNNTLHYVKATIRKEVK